MPGLDNKISNIIGTAIPTWLLKQLEARSNKNTLDSRDTQNILYLANKSAWFRLVSSVNIAEQDIPYFQKKGANITKPDDLAKNYVLFGGTSKYRPATDQRSFGYDLRSGLTNDGAYNLLNDTEINNYGYRPMPGITNVTVETQGTLGSIRGATINFKVWDKDQLDIMDALYFKLGFSMFLEWGHTYFYHSSRESPNINPNDIYSTEDFSIDPFASGLNKEEIFYQISKNVRESEGNYDAMLGLVTNFNFTYNEAGGFDCTLKILALGYLGDRIKINHPTTLPAILEAEIKQLNNIKKQIDLAQAAKDQLIIDQANAKANEEALKGKTSILELLYKASGTTPPFQKEPVSNTDKFQVLNAFGLASSNLPLITPSSAEAINQFTNYDFIGDLGFGKGITLYSLKYGLQLPQNNPEKYVTSISLNTTQLQSVLKQDYNKYIGTFSLDQVNKAKSFESYITTKFYPGADPLYFEYRYDYIGNNGKIYKIRITIKLPAKDPDIKKDINYNGSYEFWASRILKSILSDTTLSFNASNFSFNPTKVVNDTDNSTVSSKNSFQLEFRGVSPINLVYEKSIPTITTDINTNVKTNENANYTITIDDMALVSDMIANTTNPEILFADYIKRLNAQNQTQLNVPDEENPDLFVNPNQIHNAIEYMSSLEVMLRTIQVHSLGAAIQRTGDADIKREVYKVDLTKETVATKDNKTKQSLVDQIFSEGIFSQFIKTLINNTIDDSEYPKENKLAVFAKYGFNTALLGNKTTLTDLKGKEVDYKKLLTSYVIPYQINQTVTEGTNLNHPVYIQLGTLFMILNHMCTIYDTPNGTDTAKDQTPLVYIDFNPETNFCLSTNKHLSTNPFSFLIPFEGTFNDYKALFDNKVLKGNSITNTSDSQETTPLFNPESDDALSGQIPRFKYDEKSTSGNTAYKGKIMKALVNIDYLLQLVKQYSQKNDTNNVYLKPFLEQIISDMNKYLGNFNTLRVAYNDSGNTFHIVDDQLTPGDENEDFISPDNKDMLPLYGRNSIAKAIELKTDISTKLSNMIAISANSNPSEKAALSTNGSDFGFINTGYTDRYINNRTDATTNNKDQIKINDTLINAAIRFNQTITDFYSTINPSNSNVDQATNYYIQKMSKIKNDDPATRASAMIPVSLNFITDGIAGMNMGQGFTISENFLPYTYNTRTITGTGVNNIQKVGFVVLGLQHTFENNQWNTAVRANMMYLKRLSDFNTSARAALSSNKTFGYNVVNVENVQFTSYNQLTNPVVNPQFIGVVSQRDATTGGALEQRIVNISNDIFKSVASIDKNIRITVTAGNDKWHQENISYDSKHKVGKALDFTIEPATSQNKTLVTNILNSFKSKETGFSFINEYDSPSAQATGGHFHIEYN